MTDKIYVVTASANKGQNWIICKALYGGILGSDIKKTAQAMLEEEYQDIKYHGRKIPRKYFKLVEYSADNTELLKQIEQLQAENVALYKSFEWALDRGDDVCGKCAYYIPPRPDEDYTDCGHYGECVKGIVEYFKKNG